LKIETINSGVFFVLKKIKLPEHDNSKANDDKTTENLENMMELGQKM
jgi:hypothetical protein